MKIATAMGAFLSKTSFEDLSPTVVETAKYRILDSLGVQLLGYQLGQHKHLFNLLVTDGGGESTIVGEGKKAPCNIGTLINSCMANLFMADGSRRGGVHPSASVIPASLAVGEREEIDGKGLILAVVLGYEAMIRFAIAVQPSCVKRGFHPTAIVSSVGSAAASGKVLRLEEKAMAHCLSIAAPLGTGLMDAYKAGNHLAELQVARGAEAGVMAALLAQSGFKGYTPIYEESFFGAIADEYRLNLVTDDLGNQFAINQTYVKQHWACAHLLAPIDATMELVKNYGIRAEDVEAVNVYTHSVAHDADIPEPRTGKDAGFSLPFVISLLLIDGGISREKFTDEKVNDKRIQRFMKRVHGKVDPEIDKSYPKMRQVRVEIVSKSGKTYSQKLDWFRGEAECPLSKHEIEAKFMNLASGVLGEQQSKEVIAFVGGLEEAESIIPVLSLATRRKQ